MIYRDVGRFFLSRLLSLRRSGGGYLAYRSLIGIPDQAPVSGHGWTPNFMDTHVRAICRCKKTPFNYSEMKAR